VERVSVLLGSAGAAGGGAPGQAAAHAGLPALPASDRAAIALALSRLGGGVRAHCWRGDEEAERYALAAGAVAVTRIDDVEDVDFDILLAGAGGAGAGGDLLLAQLAERRRCALILEVLDVQEGTGGVLVTRDIGRGRREILSVEGPAVLGLSDQAPRLEYVSRYRRQTARPAAAVDDRPADPDPLAARSGSWEPVKPRPRTERLSERTGGSASGRMQALLGLPGGEAGEEGGGHVLQADAETCARHLLRFLSHHGIIRRRPAEAAGGAEAAGVAPRPAHPSPPRSAPLQPAPAPHAPPPTGKLARGPRPPGQASSHRSRGPFRIPEHG
jgi:electron transfer flavoprotein alpha/beta subunit